VAAAAGGGAAAAAAAEEEDLVVPLHTLHNQEHEFSLTLVARCVSQISLALVEWDRSVLL